MIETCTRYSVQPHVLLFDRLCSHLLQHAFHQRQEHQSTHASLLTRDHVQRQAHSGYPSDRETADTQQATPHHQHDSHSQRYDIANSDVSTGSDTRAARHCRNSARDHYLGGRVQCDRQDPLYAMSVSIPGYVEGLERGVDAEGG